MSALSEDAEYAGRSAPPARRRMKQVAEFSMGRVGKIMLAWLGIPVALAASMLLPSGGPADDLIEAWFYLGAATLLLNAAGVVPLRRRKLVPDDKAE